MSSFGFIDYPVVTDPNAIAATALDFLTSNLPGWTPTEGTLEEWIVLAVAQMVAEARDVASRVPRSIYRYFGKSLMGIAATEAASAEISATLTAIDGQGYVLRAGTIIGYRVDGNTLIPFAVESDVTIAAGFSSSNPGEVQLKAVTPGSAANALVPATLEMVDALAWVAQVVSTTTSSGGADAESDTDYLDRLTQELSLSSPRLILANDFSIYARTVPGVARATTIDGWDAVLATGSHSRTVSVAVVDSSGNALSSGVKATVLAVLQAQREVNFLVYVIDPTFTTINVAYTATVTPGYLPSDVQTRSIAAVTSYLQPYNWGGGDQSPPRWVFDNKVRLFEVATILNNVAGVEHITALTIMAVAADYSLSGVAPLTRPGTITATMA